MMTLKTKDEMECRDESHSEHLCYLVSQGFNLSDEQEFRALTENPRFTCHRCSRVANSDKNLCVPYDL
jgi:hypothetical protein